MKRRNSVELRDAQAQLLDKCKAIVETCKAEIREMTEEEEKEFNEAKEEIINLKAELDELNKELESYDDLLPKVEEEEKENPGCEDEDQEKRNLKTNKTNTTMKEISIVKEIRSAMENGTKQFKINADVEKRAVTVANEHDNVVETEIEGILEPLYAKSVLAELGVKFYTGMPMGDIQVPIMGRGNVGWVGEVSAAADASYGFSHVILQPKRLTAYVDISKKLLAQDTVGVENAIRRDIVNALTDKLEATIFGSAAGDSTKPAGIFYDSSIYDASTFAAVVANESKVEDNNVFGDMKYALSTGAKADLRAMPKSTKNTQLVMEGGQIDGVPAVVTSNIKTAGVYAYGDWSNLAVGSWGDIDITVDEYTQAVNGCVRLVVNAYFDCKKLRPEAFVFGKTRA